ncbi:hypothetical protein [Methylomonas sp. AM2-LC]|uniref:hypothetical protein n=1 Tax=Methylomonas sp. AM2-LC TaxID=3153301 RepID=UPI00326709F5
MDKDNDKSKTDWERLKNITDKEIEEAVRDDPDAAPILTKEEIKKRYKLNPPRIIKDVKK